MALKLAGFLTSYRDSLHFSASENFSVGKK